MSRIKDYPLHFAARAGKFELFREILFGGENPNLRNAHGMTCFHIAVMYNRAKIVKLLLKFDKVDRFARRKNGDTPFLVGCREGSLDAVIALIEENVGFYDVNMGNNGLHWACLYGRQEIIDFLLRCGFNPNFYNENGDTPLHLACQSQKLCAVKTLLQNEKTNFHLLNFINDSVLNCATRIPKINIFRHMLYNTNIDPRIKNQDGNTALHLAAFHNQIEMVEMLLQDGRVNLRDQNLTGDTSLHIAIRNSNTKMIKLMLERDTDGENLNVRNREGLNPISLGLTIGKGDVLRFYSEILVKSFVYFKFHIMTNEEKSFLYDYTVEKLTSFLVKLRNGPYKITVIFPEAIIPSFGRSLIWKTWEGVIPSTGVTSGNFIISFPDDMWGHFIHDLMEHCGVLSSIVKFIFKESELNYFSEINGKTVFAMINPKLFCKR